MSDQQAAEYDYLAALGEHWFHDGGDTCECGYWAHLDSVKRHHIADMLRPQVGTLGADERCHRCGGENVRWSAPSPLWNRVMRGNDINGEPRFSDLVCIRCFIVLAFEEGIDGTWRVAVDPEPEGLIYETPSGRIWDRSRGLWVEPSTGAFIERGNPDA